MIGPQLPERHPLQLGHARLSCVLRTFAFLGSRYVCCVLLIWGLLVWGGFSIDNPLLFALFLAVPLFLLVITFEPIIDVMLDDENPPKENL